MISIGTTPIEEVYLGTERKNNIHIGQKLVYTTVIKDFVQDASPYASYYDANELYKGFERISPILQTSKGDFLIPPMILSSVLVAINNDGHYGSSYPEGLSIITHNYNNPRLYLDKDGTMKEAFDSNGVFEYDINKNMLGYRFDGSTTNLIPNSINCYDLTNGWGDSLGVMTQNYALMLGKQATRCVRTGTTTIGGSVGGVFDVPQTGSTAGKTYTMSCWIKSNTASNQTIRIAIYEQGGATAAKVSTANIVVTPTPQRISRTYTVVDNDRTNVKFSFAEVGVNGASYDLLLNMFQVEEKSMMTNYCETPSPDNGQRDAVTVQYNALTGANNWTIYMDVRTVAGSISLITQENNTGFSPLLVGAGGDYRVRYNNVVYTFPGAPLLSSGYAKLAISYDNGVLRRSANGQYSETTGLPATGVGPLTWNTSSALFGTMYLKNFIVIRRGFSQQELIKITTP